MPGKFCIHIQDDKTNLVFTDELFRPTGRAPLAFGSIEVNMYYGREYLGFVSRGLVWCTSWWYAVEFGRLVVKCQCAEEDEL